jgi:phosphatidylglycerophosphate synthase
MVNNAKNKCKVEDKKVETVSQTRDRIRRKWGDYPLTILIINPINLRLVRIIGKTRITPNQLSLISFFITLIAALCFFSTTHFTQAIGGGLLLFGYLIDCLDGDLARLKNKKSPLGAMLDPILDRCGEIVVIIGISINGWRMTEEPAWLLSGLFLMGISQLYFYITDAMLNVFRKQSSQLNDPNRKKLLGTSIRFGVIEPFIWGQAFLSLIGMAYLGLIIFGLMFTVCCIVQFYRLYKMTRNIESNQLEDFEIHVW